MKYIVLVPLIALSVVLVGDIAFSQCPLATGCEGYPATWNSRKLTASSYRLVIEDTHGVTRSNGTLIQVSELKDNVTSAINKWLNVLNSAGEVLRIAEDEPGPEVFSTAPEQHASHRGSYCASQLLSGPLNDSFLSHRNLRLHGEIL